MSSTGYPLPLAMFKSPFTYTRWGRNQFQYRRETILNCDPSGFPLISRKIKEWNFEMKQGLFIPAPFITRHSESPYHLSADSFVNWTKKEFKSIIFWDMTPCSPLNVNRRFGGTYRLHIQGRKKKFRKKPASKQVARKRRLTLNRLHGVISRKMILFITTAVKTSNPT
jgi:hypothetical protein